MHSPTSTTAQAFRVRVPGHATYTGVFPSQSAARTNAETRFPLAHPASVTCISRANDRKGQQ